MSFLNSSDEMIQNNLTLLSSNELFKYMKKRWSHTTTRFLAFLCCGSGKETYDLHCLFFFLKKKDRNRKEVRTSSMQIVEEKKEEL